MFNESRKVRVASFALAFILVASVIICSFFTVAAAVQSGTASEKSDYSEKMISDKDTMEFESVTGNIYIIRNKDMINGIDVISAKNVTVKGSKSTVSVAIAKGTVGDAVKRSGISLAKDETCVPSADTEIKDNMVIRIIKASKVDVTADGKTKTVYLANTNIIDALNAAGYRVDSNDIISVSKDMNASQVSSVTIKRVDYKTTTVKEKVAYKSVTENSERLPLGESKISVKGENGEQLVTKEIKYIDGKRSSEKTVDTKVIKKPVNEVKLVGIKGSATGGGAGTFTDMNGNKVSYKRVLTGSGTAYTAPAGAGTATGVPAYHGGVAVNPNVIPYGSKLYIVSTDGSFVYGYATAVDTGGALMSGSAIVDCFYNTYGECVNFGRRNVNVYVL